MDPVNASNNDNNKQGYVLNDPKVRAAATRVMRASGVDFDSLDQNTKNAVLYGIATGGGALAGITGIKSLDVAAGASARYNTVSRAISNSGGIRLSGYSPAGRPINYGYAYGAGNVQRGAINGVLGAIDSRYKGTNKGNAATAVVADYISKNGGIQDGMVRNIDYGDGSTAAISRAIQTASARGGLGIDDARKLDKGLQAKQRLDRLAYERMKKNDPAFTEEFNENGEYFNSERFRKSGMREQLLSEIHANGGILDPTNTKKRLFDSADVDMGVAMLSGGGNTQYLDKRVTNSMFDNLKDNIETVSKISQEFGVTAQELEAFAKQTHMGSLSGRKSAKNMRDWAKKTRLIADAGNRDIKDVIDEQQGIADALQGAGATVTADKVLTAQQQRASILKTDANGGSVFTAEERTDSANKNNEAAEYNNRGLALTRKMMAEGLGGKNKAEIEAINKELEAGGLSFERMDELNNRVIEIARQSGMDVDRKEYMRSVMQGYSKEGDTMKMTRNAVAANYSEFAQDALLDGDSVLGSAFGGDTSAADKVSSAAFSLFNAVGQDNENRTGTRAIMDYAAKMRGMTEADRAKYTEQLQSQGVDKYTLDAASKFADMSDEQASAIADVYHNKWKNGRSTTSAISAKEEADNRRAASDAAMNRRAEEAEGYATNGQAAVSAVDQFINGALGEQDLNAADATRALYAKANYERERLIKSGKSEEEVNKMSTADLLNSSMARMGSSERFRNSDFADVSGVIGKDGKVTDIFKQRVKDELAKQGKTAEGLETDEEWLSAFEDAKGGRLQLDPNGSGNATLVTGGAVDKMNAAQAAIREKNASLVEGAGGADMASRLFQFDDNGNVIGLTGVSASKDSTGAVTGYNKREVSLDQLKDMSPETVARVFGQHMDASGKMVDYKKEDFLDGNGNLNMKALEEYARTASGTMQAADEADKGGTLPEWLNKSINEIMNNSQSIKGILSDWHNKQ